MENFGWDLFIANIFFFLIAIYIALRVGRGKFNLKAFFVGWISMLFLYFIIYSLL